MENTIKKKSYKQQVIDDCIKVIEQAKADGLYAIAPPYYLYDDKYKRQTYAMKVMKNAGFEFCKVRNLPLDAKIEYFHGNKTLMLTTKKS